MIECTGCRLQQDVANDVRKGNGPVVVQILDGDPRRVTSRHARGGGQGRVHTAD